MKNIRTFLLLVFVIKLSSCARIGSPTGGPKDSIPPVMAIAKPMNKATLFDAKKIVISFDEYVKFKNLNSQLIISPPTKTKPIIKPQGGVSKKISIQFLDSLTPNTTYTVNFGNSIVDNNEGNELGKFSYVFSTGKFLDSLSIFGRVKDPLAKKEIENISVFAYKDTHDTIVGNYTPSYVTNTLKSTVFNLENLAEANYTLIAVEDKNNNYKYDKGFEKIGFLKDQITLTNTTKDSLEFVLFKEPKDNRVFKPRQSSGQHIIVGYEGKDIPDLKIEGISSTNYLISKENKKDSLNIWLKELPLDSIYITTQQDTLINKFAYKARELKRDTLLLYHDIKSILHPRDSIKVETNIPVATIVKDSILLLENDSIPVAFDIISKSKKHQLFVDFKRKKDTKYSLRLKDSCFVDYFGTPNHKKKINFKTQSSEEYAEFVLNIENLQNHPLIVKLINNSTQKYQAKFTSSSSTLNFKNVVPDEYNIQIVKDLNNNKLYDTGDFNTKTQAEEIINYKQMIKFRANSEIIENIVVE